MKVYNYDENNRKKAAEKFNSLEDAFIVTLSQDGVMFDITLKTSNCYEYEKRKLDFDDTRDLLSLQPYPIIFCGIDPIIVEELQQAPSDYNEPKKSTAEPFFVDEGNSILKVSVSIGEEDLKEILRLVLDNETEFVKGRNINYFVPFTSFFQNEELYSTTSYPLIINSYGDVRLPDYGYGIPSLYYTLSRLYSGKDEIHLSSDDLSNIYRASNGDTSFFVLKLLNKLHVRILAEYDKKEIAAATDCLSEFSVAEKIKIDNITEVRNILLESDRNKTLLEKLEIDPRKRAQREKDAQKKLTSL